MANEVIALINKLPAGTAKPLVQIDNTDLDGWPFEWYFRNLPAGDVTYSSSFAGATAPVLIMLGPQSDTYNAQLVHRYDRSQYRWNWWFPEDYKGFTFDHGMCGSAYAEVACQPGQTGMTFLKTGTPCAENSTNVTNCSAIQSPASIDLLDAVTNPTSYGNLWNWFVFRKPFGARGARMMDVYIRKDLLPEGSGTFQAGTSASTTAAQSYPAVKFKMVHAFGGSTISLAEGGTIGPSGKIYIADAGNHRIDILSHDGKLLQTIGSSGTGPGQFNVSQSPMDVAVGPNGDIYAADWWGNRIEEFTAKGTFIRSWGRSGSTGPYGMYGPRSVAVGQHGVVYVADTGNERVSAYSARGAFLFSFGSRGAGSGQFDEPSSVFVGPRGGLYVDDMWNGRIERFSPTGKFITSWPVPWTSQSYQEPYGTVLSNGNIVVSDPDNVRLLEYTSRGTLLGQYTNSGLSLPSGVFAGKHGRLFVVDSTRNRIDELAPSKASP